MSDGFITWDDSKGSIERAQAEYADSTQAFTGVYKESFSSGSRRTFTDIGPNRTVRPDFNRGDYDAFREDSAMPSDKRTAIKLCMEAYKSVGIIRNVIDLMGDFACQGVTLVHRDRSAESFFLQWWKSVQGKERSERFLNHLYRTGNVVSYKSYADVTPSLKNFMKTIANDIKIEIPEVKKNRIPFRYTFFNPLSLDTKNGELHLNITSETKVINNNGFNASFRTNSVPKHVFDLLPTKLRNQINNNQQQIRLEPERLALAHYKKDDWEQWADPLVHAILDDIMMLEKMRLADLSALDGAISNIRLWTLGSLDHKILPNKEAINRLRDILASNQGGGTMELVYGPELAFTESATEVHKFLGSEKYSSVLNAIYAGMGVPQTLTGMAGNGGGFTNNFISLKTLVERLQYGRDLLVAFWEKEVEEVRKAMGFRYAPEVRFDQMSLSDEAAEKNLLIQLADRDIISHETILERFKEAPKVEKVRLLREIEDRQKDDTPEKAGPFHNANNPQELEKMDKQFKQEDKNKDKEFEQKKFEIKNAPKPAAPPGGAKKPASKKPASTKGPGKQNGRPKNSTDKTPRKKRAEKPRSKPGVSKAIAWAESAWEDVSAVLTRATLEVSNKDNLRKLTKARIRELEELKVDVFTNMEPMVDIDETSIIEAVQGGYKPPLAFQELMADHGVGLDNMPIEEYRKSIIGLYVEYVTSD